MLKIKTKKVYIFIAVIGLLIFLHYIRVLAPIENIIIKFFNPLASGFYSVSSDIRVVYNDQTNKRDLLKIIKELEIENSQLIKEQAQLKYAEEENKSLREHLKFFTKNEYNYVLANIIFEDIFIGSTSSNDKSNKISSNIIINKGKKDGFKIGLVAVNSQGITIGKITEANNNTARISLATNNNCKFAAKIQNQDSERNNVSQTSGIAQGELNLTIAMNFIPQTKIVSEGDIIVTSGLEKDIPGGLVIGKVIKVENDTNEVWQKAVIEPLADFNDLSVVSVLLP